MSLETLKPFKLTGLALAAAALCMLAQSAAQPSTQSTTPPIKAQACAACHGIAGVSASPDIPNLAGQKVNYLENQLKAFRSGTRKNELMAAIATQLSDADIQQLAAHWSSLPAASAPSAATSSPASANINAVRSAMPFPGELTVAKGYTEYAREEDAESKLITVRYANRVALAAARAGKPLPDGSAIVSANYALEKDGQGRSTQGKLVSIAGMEARATWGEAVPELLRNGNWHYGLWNAQGEPRLANQAQCLACHKPKATDSYVFTLGALRKAATAAN